MVIGINNVVGEICFFRKENVSDFFIFLAVVLISSGDLCRLDDNLSKFFYVTRYLVLKL